MRRFIGRSRVFILFLLSLFVHVPGLRAAPPTLDYLFPAGGQRGTNLAVSAGGKLDPWPVKVWVDCSGLSFIAQTNKGAFIVQISEEVPLGPHLVRTYTEEGASEPRCLVAGDQIEQLETEPNDNPTHSQLIEKLPALINGRLDKNGDVDCFTVRLEAGKWFVASVDGSSLGSPMDPMLHLLDSQGVRVAFGNDSYNLDPILAYKAEKSGTYVLELMAFVYPPQADVRFTGGSNFIYRLRITDGPFANYTIPGGIERGHKTAIELFGWNLSSNLSSVEFEVDTSGAETNADYTAVSYPGLENRLQIPIVTKPEQREIEPNNKFEQAQKVTVPCIMNGRIDPAGDEDHFVFTAKKAEQFSFRAQSPTLGFPLDPTIKIEDKSGKQLAENDDADGSQDSVLAWTAPADDAYALSICDRTRNGGSDFVYRLDIGHPIADFKVSVENHAFRIEPGKSTELKVNISRLNGYQSELAITANGLPDGVTAKEVRVPEKAVEAQLLLSASPEARPANQPIRILASAIGTNQPLARLATFDLRGKEARGSLLINQTHQIWLTVLPMASSK